MYNKTKKIIYLTISLPILYLLLFELILRISIFFFTLNSGILVYGINKNISLTLHSISKGEFYIVNSSKSFDKSEIIKSSSKNQIWIFGGSTSNIGFCDSKNLSWVDLLDTKLEKKNFSKNGINSTSSLNLLKNEFQKKDIPKTIIWANKVNEILHSKRSQNKKNKINYLINSIKLSLKENILVFYFFDEILLRFFDKININIRNEKSFLNENDYIFSSNKYYQNTKKAIELSEKYGVESFYIVSIFNKLNLKSEETKFFEYYSAQAKNLSKTYNFVEFINTKNYLSSNNKDSELFCDIMHHNYNGKVLTANIISNLINDKK